MNGHVHFQGGGAHACQGLMNSNLKNVSITLVCGSEQDWWECVISKP